MIFLWVNLYIYFCKYLAIKKLTHINVYANDNNIPWSWFLLLESVWEKNFTLVAVNSLPNAKWTRMVKTVAIFGVIGVREILKLCM